MNVQTNKVLYDMKLFPATTDNMQGFKAPKMY